VEIYPLGILDFELSEKIAKGIVSPEGKLVAEKANNRLIVLDVPARHAELKQAFRQLRPEIHHVRIQVTFAERGVGTTESFRVDGRLSVGSVILRTPDAPADGSVRIQADESRLSMASLVKQELIVLSGSTARIRVGTDIPYADWIWDYGVQRGYWTGAEGAGYQGAGAVRWREVGAQLVIEPYVLGSTVRVRLTPEFSYILDKDRLTTAVEKLTTEVMVEDGQEIELGGIPVSDREFYSRFLTGYTHDGEKRSLRILLKPTIETTKPP